MKKVLYIATVAQKHINVFHIPFLKMLQNDGYKTYVAAANDTDQENLTIPHCDEYVEIDFKRNPLHPGNLVAYHKLKKFIDQNTFEIIHCHTPVGGLLGRLAARKARKNGTRIFYTAHGFHFYKGAPLINWLLYYPVEKFCSRLTDVLITINDEDFALAKSKMKAKRTEHVPGVGIDSVNINSADFNKNAKRHELEIPTEAFLITSVGEINKNKNHEVVIRAIAKLSNDRIHYAIVGIGPLQKKLTKLSEKLGVSSRIHFLGYRNDVAEIYKASDVCCFPSIREGLPLAPLEGMACGLPIVAADNRGTRCFMKNGENGFMCKSNSASEFAQALKTLISNVGLQKKFSQEAIVTASKYSRDNILKAIRALYE